MPIRPLEKKERDRFVPKLIFLTVFLCSAIVLNFLFKDKIRKPQDILGAEGVDTNNNLKTIADQVSNQAKQTAEDILNETTNVVQHIASQSSSTVSQAVIDTAIRTVADQLKRLPANEQEKIRQEICK